MKCFERYKKDKKRKEKEKKKENNNNSNIIKRRKEKKKQIKQIKGEMRECSLYPCVGLQEVPAVMHM
ncbi:hypothetical protein, unlikely [Trypanosoma brucei gambiense DAL972]|uniref:Uncharacterized protein n=1 Tax=Trypanosoma brucei gambiense (strain MHOM/CI/86/DAL972) TaxID=679716 RepID=C9ZI06_TRYB9|nr:hypothetical protein, unlikely [Trypanosoma brucei gambiense DAL972]CBH09123.1 hypothetical protein, unlikely [Trypanosoma brucei gambiense DAL972]|eukprot:XP_011771564.1 hypothetical protein, unlikely [Trypanosoma brucei gambiense DAL972]